MPDGTPLRVLEISSGIAGAYAGWLLKQLGARVARPGAAEPTGSDAISLALGYFNAGKPAAEENGWHTVDLVITDDVRLFERHAGATPQQLVERHPRLVLGVASIFGLTGDLAAAPATALDAQAVSGVAWAIGEPSRAPLSLPPGILECQAGIHLAAASLMARHIGGGRVVDIALADILATYVAGNCRFYIHHGLTWQRAGRRAAGSGGAYPFVILPCADGEVCLTGRTRPEWERFVGAMGKPAWARQPRYQKLRAMGTEYPDEVDALVLPWLRQRTKAEIEDIAHRNQLTIAPLRHLADVLATPQLHHRGFFKAFTLGEATLQAPGLPFRTAEQRTPDAGLAPTLLSHAGGITPGAAADTARPLAALRVLDLGWVWSAPQVSGVLAQFGAEVIKVEHTRRLDNTRLSGLVFRDGQRIDGPTTEMSPMFHQINQGKLGITLNTKEPDAVALIHRLAAISDVVIENMSAGTMERTGLGYAVLQKINPRIIMLAMSGAGQFGPLADMRTYAPAMSSFAGLEALVGYRGERPVGLLNFALGDPNAAAHALLALFAALARREATGTGCYVDLSQTEALLTTLTPWLLQAQVDAAQPRPLGNAHPTMAPHGIYPAAGPDRWLSIAVQDDARWAALAPLLGTADIRFTAAAGRIAHRDALDTLIAAWTARTDRDELVATLRAAGIAASPVQSVEELWSDPHFAARHLKQPVELPVMGEVDLFRAPWMVSGTAAKISRGPRLGEHNERVLRGFLGLTAERFDRLMQAGVIQ